jgi:sulfhydrogenase subunit gamma (sulfur reductase)
MTQIAASMVPHEAEVVARIEESPSIFTLRLRFTDPEIHAAYRFAPGQFNMLYLPGGGEVAISIVSDPEDEHMFDHTIRRVGRVTHAMAGQLRVGDRIGVRGPYGRGWPIAEAEGRDVVIATGGLGCAPVVAMIHYILRRRDRFGRLVIMQGVKHRDDLIWREQYTAWQQEPETQVLLSAVDGGGDWPFHTGHLPVVFDEAKFDTHQAIVMMCGPEGMMRAVAAEMVRRGVAADRVWLSLERNMKCGIGRCGHCQLAPHFVCADGPVFRWDQVAPLMAVEGL